jgi:hypothetical protein
MRSGTLPAILSPDRVQMKFGEPPMSNCSLFMVSYRWAGLSPLRLLSLVYRIPGVVYEPLWTGPGTVTVDETVF